MAPWAPQCAVICRSYLLLLSLALCAQLSSAQTSLEGSGNVSISNSSNVSFNTPPTTYSVPFTSTELNTKLTIIRNFTAPTWIKFIGRKIIPVSSLSLTGLLYNDFTFLRGLSTLWVMNLTNEYNSAKEYVNMDLNAFWMMKQMMSAMNPEDIYWRKIVFMPANRTMIVPEIVTEYIGSLMSIHALDADKQGSFAFQTIMALQKVFRGKNGVPYKLLNSLTGAVSSQSYNLGEFGPVGMLEFKYVEALASQQNDADSRRILSRWAQPYQKMLAVLGQMNTTQRPNGLYLSELSIDKDGKAVVSGKSTLFVPSSPFYSMLIKEYIASNRTNEMTLKMYIDAIDAVENVGMISKNSNGLTFAQSYESGKLDRTMLHDGCGLGAMFALGAKAMNETFQADKELSLKKKKLQMQRVKKHMNWAVELTETCHCIANQSESGLFPVKVIFHENGTIESVEGAFYDHSDLAESYFVLWRLTKDPKYQHYAWELFQSLYHYCKQNPSIPDAPWTWDGVANKTLETEMKEDFNIKVLGKEYGNYFQDENYIDIPGQLFATTLKYLYLTFAPLELLPLDKWVFNRVGQPIPVYGKV